VPIPGRKRVEYLDENLGVLDVRLAPEDLAQIDAVLSAGAVSGDRYHAEAMKAEVLVLYYISVIICASRREKGVFANHYSQKGCGDVRKRGYPDVSFQAGTEARSSLTVCSRRGRPPKVMPRAWSLEVTIWFLGVGAVPRMEDGLPESSLATVATSKSAV
jgi:hypothetical protein